MDPLRSQGDSLSMQIDSPQIGRSILTIQSFDSAYERQVQRAFEVLEARPAMEIGSGASQGVGQVASNIAAQQADSAAKTGESDKLLPETVTNQLPEEMRDWPLWQLIVSALGAIAVVALVIGLVLRPKHHSSE